MRSGLICTFFISWSILQLAVPIQTPEGCETAKVSFPNLLGDILDGETLTRIEPLLTDEKKAIGGCPGNKYLCSGSEDVCLRPGNMCDGTADCVQGDDEDVNTCETHCHNISRWWCTRKDSCLKYTKLCDGQDDCPRANRVALDEKPDTCRSILCQGKYTRCGSKSLQCINVKNVCDGTPECNNTWDELSCNVTCSPSTNYSEEFPLVTPVRELNGETICSTALDIHNELRRYHTDTEDLRYDIELGETAEEMAMSFAHRFAIRADQIDGHVINHEFGIGQLSYIGLNISGLITTYISQAIYQWYNRSMDCNYDYASGNYDEDCSIETFRQIVWADNAFVGCGAAAAHLDIPEASSFDNPQVVFIVCNYLVKPDPVEFVGYIQPLKDDNNYPIMPDYPVLE